MFRNLSFGESVEISLCPSTSPLFFAGISPARITRFRSSLTFPSDAARTARDKACESEDASERHDVKTVRHISLAPIRSVNFRSEVIRKAHCGRSPSRGMLTADSASAPLSQVYSAASFLELRSKHEINMSVDMMSPKVR